MVDCQSVLAKHATGNCSAGALPQVWGCSGVAHGARVAAEGGPSTCHPAPGLASVLRLTPASGLDLDEGTS